MVCTNLAGWGDALIFASCGARDMCAVSWAFDALCDWVDVNLDITISIEVLFLRVEEGQTSGKICKKRWNVWVFMRSVLVLCIGCNVVTWEFGHQGVTLMHCDHSLCDTQHSIWEKSTKAVILPNSVTCPSNMVHLWWEVACSSKKKRYSSNAIVFCH